MLLLALLPVGLWLWLRPSSHGQAEPVPSTSIASIVHALPANVRLAGTPAGPAAAVALAGPAAQPRRVLLDAAVGGASERLETASLRWSGNHLTSLRLTGPFLQATSAAQTDLGTAAGYIFYATQVAGQYQTVSLAVPAGRTWVFAFRRPQAAVRLSWSPGASPSLAVYRRGSQGAWRRATIRLNRGTPGSSSPALAEVRAPINHNSLFIRLVEGVRRHLGSPLVAGIENAWYSLADLVHRSLYALGHHPVHVHASSPAPTATRTRNTGLPGNLAVPAAWPQATGEGVWQPVGPSVHGVPAMERTFLHPDPARPYATVDLVWINPRALHLHLVAGTRQPRAASGIHGPGEIPVSSALRRRVVAAFNAGFKTASGSFGEQVNGELYTRPVPGLATLAIYRSGRVALGTWGRQVGAAPSLVSFRQNLPLIVDHGKLSPLLDQPSAWGAVVGNSTFVWRSGIGITPQGDLIYAAGVPLSAATLARSLLQAGCGRAMQLDINSYWVTFNFYRWTGTTLHGHKLLPSMVRSSDRYLRPDTRDFFYLTLPSAGGRSAG